MDKKLLGRSIGMMSYSRVFVQSFPMLTPKWISIRAFGSNSIVNDGEIESKNSREDLKGSDFRSHIERETVCELGLESRFDLFDKSKPASMRPGDIIKVESIQSRSKERTNSFTGICLAIRRRGIGSNFMLWNIIDKVGVCMTYPFFSPLIKKIEIVKRGDVRKAKLYYLMERRAASKGSYNG